MLPLSLVPQSPVQLVAVAPMVALPPVPALTVSVHWFCANVTVTDCEVGAVSAAPTVTRQVAEVVVVVVGAPAHTPPHPETCLPALGVAVMLSWFPHAPVDVPTFPPPPVFPLRRHHGLKLAVSPYVPGAPVAEPMVGVHVALDPQRLTQVIGVSVHLVKR